ncbi:hypothetical protein ABTB07_22275 [Acinetobacter baumannii]
MVDLPAGMPREVMEHLKRVRVAGQPLRIRRLDADRPAPRKPYKPRGTQRG